LDPEIRSLGSELPIKEATNLGHNIFKDLFSKHSRVPSSENFLEKF
jgi:hypothetical protein